MAVHIGSQRRTHTRKGKANPPGLQVADQAPQRFCCPLASEPESNTGSDRSRNGEQGEGNTRHEYGADRRTPPPPDATEGKVAVPIRQDEQTFRFGSRWIQQPPASLRSMNEHILDRGTQVAEHRSLGFRWRGWIGIAVLVPAGMFTLLSLPPSHEGSWADIVAEALAWPVFLAGGTLRFWATLYVGGRKRKTVVREGPYSICRNPLYLGSLLLALSSGLFLQSVTFTIGACLMAIGYMVVTVPVEERFLLARLGQEYEAYCRSVPRYLPRLSALVTPAYVDVDVRALAQEASKAIGWIWIPVIAEVVMQLRLLPWWPHWFSLP